MVGRDGIVVRIAGVGVRIRRGGIVLVTAVIALLGLRLLPAAAPHTAPALLWATASGAGALLALGVILHEVGHALAGRRAGLRADVVELRLWGGATEFNMEPTTPSGLLRVAAAGPAVSLAYAVALGMATLGLSSAGAPAVVMAAGGYVAAASAAVGLLNLLPGSPLDGGRILHAWVWRRHGDPRRGAYAAVRAGRLLGLLLIMAGGGLAAAHMIGPVSGLGLAASGAAGWLGATAERRELRCVPRRSGPGPTTTPRPAGAAGKASPR